MNNQNSTVYTSHNHLFLLFEVLYSVFLDLIKVVVFFVLIIFLGRLLPNIEDYLKWLFGERTEELATKNKLAFIVPSVFKGSKRKKAKEKLKNKDLNNFPFRSHESIYNNAFFRKRQFIRKMYM